MAIVYILLSIAAIIGLITKLRLHPFLALLLVSIVLGLVTGMSPAVVISSIQDGFGGTLGKIGLVIILGIFIGAFLENTGAAMTLAMKILSLTGKKRVPTAMGIIGYIISIPVFSDSGFVLLSSLNRNLTRKAGLTLAATAIALGLGLSVTHALVPPTPGPIAAAGILGANLGLVIGIGLLMAGIGLIAALVFVKKVASKVYINPGPVQDENPADREAPPFFLSLLPILVPIILIIAKSILSLQDPHQPVSGFKTVISFLGEPVIALLIGFGCCLFLPKKPDKEMLSVDGWTGKALKDAAVIIMITGAGGIFGKVLQNSNVASMLGETLTATPMGIWLPFILAAALKTAQGSSTVALITTASVMAPMMASLGFSSEMDKAMVVIAIGAGSLVVSHVNDSFFWVVTQMSGMNVKTGYKLHTTGTLVIGSAAMTGLFILFSIVH